jgi:transposase
MPTPLSMDLRVRVLAAVTQVLSHRQVGERFGVSAASVSRWRALQREQGEARARPMGGDRRSERIEAHKDTILILEAKSDIAIEELRDALGAKGVVVGYGTTRHFFARHAITRKKDCARQRTGSADVLKRRQAWFEGQLDLDPERLVFIDET